jgi:electron transport complex protein RnfB
MNIVYALVVLGGLGLVFGGLLSYVAQRFAVEEDERVEIIADLLPGANCGACGYPGCLNLAEKLVAGEAPVDSCVPGGKAVSDNICRVLGLETVASDVRKIAEIYCLGTRDVAPDRFEYQGVQDCNAAMMYAGGFKICQYGCLGLGTCVEACPFEAISMGEDGLPVVDPERCTGCGICAKACPRGVIRIVNAERGGKYVPCNSKDRGRATRQACEVGCIGCKACVKACPQEAIVVEDYLAVIDREKCDNCGECVESCRREIIKDIKVYVH